MSTFSRIGAHLILAALGASACGSQLQPPTLSVQRSAIVGGTYDPGDPAVLAFSWVSQVTSPGQTYLLCSGTLIGPRTVLTAGHCINAADSGGTLYEYRAQITSVARGPGTSQGYPFDCQAPACRAHEVVQQVRHPDYSLVGDSAVNDVGVIELDTAETDVASLDLNTTSLGTDLVGQAIRHVGFGVTNPSDTTSVGYKMQATWPVNSVAVDQIESHSATQNTCNGDSGGPGLLVTAGSRVERVASIVSHGDGACSQTGFDSRVDHFLPFIQSTMAVWESTPSCSLDGWCVPGCGDPDCAAFAQHCSADRQCEAQVCWNDPQHQNYCSQSCDATHLCPAGFDCNAQQLCEYTPKPVVTHGLPCAATDFCDKFEVCAGRPGQPTTCNAPCELGTTGETCASTGPNTCLVAATGQLYCEDSPGSLYSSTPAHPGGCSSTAGATSFSALFALALIGLRRARAGPWHIARR